MRVLVLSVLLLPVMGCSEVSDLWSKVTSPRDAVAQFDLGKMYANGEGVPGDDKVATS